MRVLDSVSVHNRNLTIWGKLGLGALIFKDVIFQEEISSRQETRVGWIKNWKSEEWKIYELIRWHL